MKKIVSVILSLVLIMACLAFPVHAMSPTDWEKKSIYFIMTDRFHNGNTAITEIFHNRITTITIRI